MKRYRFFTFLLVAALLLSLTACGGNEEGPDPNSPDVASGTQTVVVEGFDWGPAVTKTVITLNRTVEADSVKAENFTVIEHKENLKGLPFGLHFTGDSDRTVTAAYVCDEQGNPLEGASNMIALELAYAPSVGSPFCYGLMTSKNTICEPYELKISLAEGCSLTDADGSAITGLAVTKTIDLSAAHMPQLEGVNLSGTFTGEDDRVLTYASYAPADDGEKHPLVIWLHGAGEGGTNPVVALLGNEVSVLFGEEFQSVMGGAYVLAPQTPEFWMVYNEKGDWQDNPGTSSVYLATLMELIEGYVAENQNIDPDRIYVGGCSNGGYMTMDLILNYPEYFAAAFPICESYQDAGITDQQLESIKDLPIWFVYTENDETVDPQKHEIPTINRLKSIGSDVRVSVFEDVHDTSETYTEEDGNPYQYNGHWSWIYFFNNECEDGDVNMWQWLSEQSK